MKKTIKNPNKVSFKIYIIILSASLLGLICSLFIQPQNCTLLTVFLDVLKNLSFGCIASTLVALLIDCANVRNMNMKANNVYDAIYADLQFQISYYISLWSEMCAVVYKDIDYKQEKHTWVDWYQIVKDNFIALDEAKQKDILTFFQDRLKYCVEKVNTSINEIYSQRYLLTINDLHNSEMEQIISDFKFEFYALDLTLSRDINDITFWSRMDAITIDLENYINAWTDISYYNKLKFKPYKFHSDANETVKAILLENGISEQLIDSALKTTKR